MKKTVKLKDGCTFTEKSQTQPGLAFTGAELLRRSLNGTMPAIYQDASPYDFEDVVNGKQITYAEQEIWDVEPLPAFPSLEEVFEMREMAQRTLSDANRLIKKHLEQENKVEEVTPVTQPEAL